MHDEHGGAPERAPNDRSRTLPPGPQGPGAGPRLAAITDEVAHRLRDVCREMPPAAFEVLVREVALTRWRWEQRRRGAD